MFKKYILSLALFGSIHQSQAHDDIKSILDATHINTGTADIAKETPEPGYNLDELKNGQNIVENCRYLLRDCVNYCFVGTCYPQNRIEITKDGELIVIVANKNLPSDSLLSSVLNDPLLATAILISACIIVSSSSQA